MQRYLLLILILVLTPLSHAEIYKWVDAEGQVHFGDQQPSSGDVESLALKINTYTNVTYDTSLFDHRDRFGAKNVVIYSAEWCGVCKRAKRFLRDKSIAFTEYDIDKNEANKKRYRQLGASGVPVIFVGKKRMKGFSEAGFMQMYR